VSYRRRPSRTVDSVLAAPTSGQVLYRLVRRYAAEEVDFVARALKRRPFTDTPLLLHSGVSMFAEASQAASRARRSPIVIAEVHLQTDRDIHVAKTLISEGCDTRRAGRLTRVLSAWTQVSIADMTYEVVDIESGDVLAAYDSEDVAAARLVDYVHEHPEAADAPAVATVDDTGHAIGMVSGETLLAHAGHSA
jgi:hypothetical protein